VREGPLLTHLTTGGSSWVPLWH